MEQTRLSRVVTDGFERRDAHHNRAGQLEAGGPRVLTVMCYHVSLLVQFCLFMFSTVENCYYLQHSRAAPNTREQDTQVCLHLLHITHTVSVDTPLGTHWTDVLSF